MCMCLAIVMAGKDKVLTTLITLAFIFAIIVIRSLVPNSHNREKSRCKRMQTSKGLLPGRTGWSVAAVYYGKTKKYDEWYRGATSAINKKRTTEAVEITRLGITGDEQSRKSHGGPGRALLHYASEHYEEIADWYKEKESVKDGEAFLKQLKPPGFGENISTSCGMTEHTVCIGDIYMLGTSVIQVSQPRAPCFHLNHQFKTKRRGSLISNLVELRQMSGWLYRVLKPGKFQAGDDFILLRRPLPELPVSFVHRMVSAEIFYLEDVKEIADCKLLDDKWRKYARERIKNGNKPVSMAVRLLGKEGQCRYTEPGAKYVKPEQRTHHVRS